MSPTLASMIESLPTWFSGGAGLGAGYFLVRFLFGWAGGRIDKREAVVEQGMARLDAATATLIGNLERRVEALSGRVEQLESDLAECTRRDLERAREMNKMRAVMHGLVPKRRNAGIEKARRKLDEGEKP